MTNAPKRYSTPCGHGIKPHPEGLAYRKEEVDAYIADLSADLVQAGYLAGLEAAIEAANQDSLDGDISLGALQWVTDTIRALSADPEALAAIVAQVTEGGE